MEWIFIGIAIAIGFYFAPFIVAFFVGLIAVVIVGIKEVIKFLKGGK